MSSSTSADTAAEKAAKELQGEWKAVEVEIQGEKSPEDQVKNFRVVIKGDILNIEVGNLGIRRKKFKLDPTKTPKAMDLTSLDGPAKGKDHAAIYELEKGRLRICFPDWTGGPAKRPPEFRTQPGDGYGLLTLERVKAK
jgi:RNA polymerase sigma-70 factor (ECF subfamily)